MFNLRRKTLANKKRMRGEPVFYDEVKKTINLKLTPTAIKKLTTEAKDFNLSRSEFLEQFIRSEFLEQFSSYLKTR